MSTTVDEAKALLASGKQIGLDLAIQLTTEVAEHKGLDYIYTDAQGVRAGTGSYAATCANVHYQMDAQGLPVRGEDGQYIRSPGCLVGGVFCELFPIET